MNSVERDHEGRERMLELAGGNRSVPVIVEEGRPIQIGWMGRSCYI